MDLGIFFFFYDETEKETQGKLGELEGTGQRKCGNEYNQDTLYASINLSEINSYIISLI